MTHLYKDPEPEKVLKRATCFKSVVQVKISFHAQSTQKQCPSNLFSPKQMKRRKPNPANL